MTHKEVKANANRRPLKKLVRLLDERRRRIFWRLHLLSGRTEGEVSCWWVLTLWCMARPVTLIEMLGARVWSPMSPFTVQISGMRFTMELFRMMDTSPEPGPWIRIVKREDGYLTVEQRREA